ncbi:hypothetical protein INR49_011796 [Caranx melampygus]|nr:hypothetical protein INR49_011796 [Caranx melampygus]
MGTGDYICVTLRGGAPWGFTLREGEGDTYRPFLISQVEEDGRAFLAGVQEGDEVVSLNGEPCADLTLLRAYALIDTSIDCLQLLLKRHCSIPPEDYESEKTYCGQRDSSNAALESTTLHIFSPKHRSQSPRELYISESQDETYYAELDTQFPRKPQLLCTQLHAPSSDYQRGQYGVYQEKEVQRSFPPGDMVELQVSLSEQTLDDAGCTSLGSAHGIEGELSNREAIETIHTTTSYCVPHSVREPLGQHGVVLSSPSMLGQVEVILQQPSASGAGRGILSVGGPRVSGRLRRSESLSEKQVKEAKSKCKRIALLLTAAPPNPNNKGVLMFKKHRQRAKKYTLVSYGTGEDEPEYSDEEDEENEEDKQDTHTVEFTLVAPSDSEIDKNFLTNAHSSKGVLTVNWDKGLLEIERNLNNQAEMECLPETKGKGALMFAQRRQRMDEISAEHDELRRQGIPVEAVQENEKKTIEMTNQDTAQHAENSVSTPAVAPTADTTPAPELEPTSAPAPEPSPPPAPQEAPASTTTEEQHIRTLPEHESQQQPQQVTAQEENGPSYEMPVVKGKGADMFAKRQSRMEKFVVDSETALGRSYSLSPPARVPSTGQKSVSTSSSPRPPTRASTTPPTRKTSWLEKGHKPPSPWEAASRHPLGLVDEAFTSQNLHQTLASNIRLAAQRKMLPEPPVEWKARVSYQAPWKKGSHTWSQSQSRSQSRAPLPSFVSPTKSAVSPPAGHAGYRSLPRQWQPQRSVTEANLGYSVSSPECCTDVRCLLSLSASPPVPPGAAMSRFSTMTTQERKIQAAAICREVQAQEDLEMDLGKKMCVPKDIMLEELSLASNRGSRLFKMRQRRSEKYTFESIQNQNNKQLNDAVVSQTENENAADSHGGQNNTGVEQPSDAPETAVVPNPDSIAPGYGGPLKDIPAEKFNCTAVPKSYHSPWEQAIISDPALADTLVNRMPEPEPRADLPGYKSFNRVATPFGGFSKTPRPVPIKPVQVEPLPDFPELQAEITENRPSFNRAALGWVSTCGPVTLPTVPLEPMSIPESEDL